MERESTFKERLIWTLLSAAAVAASAYLAQRALAAGWQRATGREPPRDLKLLSPAGRRAGRGAASFVVDRALAPLRS